MTIKRIGQVIGIKPEEIAEYERIHEEIWPTVAATLKQANIQNYSIFRYELQTILLEEFVNILFLPQHILNVIPDLTHS